MAFRKDPAGRHWIYTACEGEGAERLVAEQGSVARRARGDGDQRRRSRRSVDVSNGRFMGKTDLGDGYTRWDWQIHYPINCYNVR